MFRAIPGSDDRYERRFAHVRHPTPAEVRSATRSRVARRVRSEPLVVPQQGNLRFDAVRRYARSDGWLVDVGAGAGGVTAMLGWPPDATLALEADDALVRETRRRHTLVAAVGTRPRSR